MSPPKHHLSVTGKPPPEKSRFLQTCNRLSLFLKEKGNIRDLNLEINAKFDASGVTEASPTTVDLLSNIDEKTSQVEKSARIDLPQYVILDSSFKLEDSTNKASSVEPVTNPETAQMTIFYQGQVLVLDDVAADRARDLMLMAKNGGKMENGIELKGRGDVGGSKEARKAEVQGKDSDLPIARRASLHKFLAKRKDRATVRAPVFFQERNQSPGGSSSGTGRGFDLNM